MKIIDSILRFTGVEITEIDPIYESVTIYDLARFCNSNKVKVSIGDWEHLEEAGLCKLKLTNAEKPYNAEWVQIRHETLKNKSDTMRILFMVNTLLQERANNIKKNSL